MSVQREMEILSVIINNLDELHRSYMPFIVNGGLFVPTTNSYLLNHELFILLRLIDIPERLSISGKVIWITPANSDNYRTQGVGIQFYDGFLTSFWSCKSSELAWIKSISIFTDSYQLSNVSFSCAFSFIWEIAVSSAI